MALIRQRASALLEQAQSGQLAKAMKQRARFASIAAGVSEVSSWAGSLLPFLTDIVDAGLGDVEVLLEHQLPYSPKRADAILCGVHPRTGRPSYVIVELKQWTDVIAATDELVTVRGMSRKLLHPVEQVRRYCRQLVDFTAFLAAERDLVSGISYLHNAHDSGVWMLRQYHMDEHGQLFTVDNKAQFVAHLRSRLDTGPVARDGARVAADRLLGADCRPAKPLMSVAAHEIRDREQFVLLDEQQVAYRTVMSAVERARSARKQTVVIVTGGPGSGKSVIALSLLGDLSRQGRPALHATGSKAFTRTLRKLVGSRNSGTQNLFVYFNSFTKARPRELDVIICDEAHRLREKSVDRFTPRDLREAARPQIEELIDAAYVPVFLLDEHQVVRPGEMGTVADIQAVATRLGCDVEIVALDGQYRCGGSAFYDVWVAGVLGIGSEPTPWSGMTAGSDDRFVVASEASPEDLEKWLIARCTGEATARIAAGFCWRWSDPARDHDGTKRLVNDVVVGKWSRPWNAKDKESVPGIPESNLWATDPRGFGQVGCVYTAQGFEYDWAGVIFAEDFVRRDDRWIAQPWLSRDPAITTKLSADQAHELIRNTYKVLLTRGLQGVCLHSTDAQTQEFLSAMTR